MSAYQKVTSFIVYSQGQHHVLFFVFLFFDQSDFLKNIKKHVNIICKKELNKQGQVWNSDDVTFLIGYFFVKHLIIRVQQSISSILKCNLCELRQVAQVAPSS